jgi:hypothetical protein
VAFTAVNVNDFDALEGSHHAHVVLVNRIASAKLPTVPTAPGKNLALLIDCSYVIVTKCNFKDGLAFQFCHLSWNGLSTNISVAEASKLPITPSVDYTVISDGTRVVVARLNIHWDLLIVGERVRLDLMWAANILRDCRRGAWPSTSWPIGEAIRIARASTLLLCTALISCHAELPLIVVAPNKELRRDLRPIVFFLTRCVRRCNSFVNQYHISKGESMIFAARHLTDAH